MNLLSTLRYKEYENLLSTMRSVGLLLKDVWVAFKSVIVECVRNTKECNYKKHCCKESG